LTEAQLLVYDKVVDYWSKKYTLQKKNAIALLAASEESGVDATA
jgi:hypothetical protein